MSNDKYSSRRDTRDSRDNIGNNIANKSIVSGSSGSSSTMARVAAEIEKARGNSTRDIDIRLRPVPQAGEGATVRHAGILSSVSRAEMAMNDGIQAKLGLNEDRSLSQLIRKVVLFLDNSSSFSKEPVMDLLSMYSLREVRLGSIQAGATDDMIGYVSSLVKEVSDKTQMYNSKILKATVAEASLNRIRKTEYNSIAKAICEKRPKVESEMDLRNLRQTLNDLEGNSARLLRISELRRKQFAAVDNWVEVLHSGEI